MIHIFGCGFKAGRPIEVEETRIDTLGTVLQHQGMRGGHIMKQKT